MRKKVKFGPEVKLFNLGQYMGLAECGSTTRCTIALAGVDQVEGAIRCRVLANPDRMILSTDTDAHIFTITKKAKEVAQLNDKGRLSADDPRLRVMRFRRTAVRAIPVRSEAEKKALRERIAAHRAAQAAAGIFPAPGPREPNMRTLTRMLAGAKRKLADNVRSINR